MPILPWRRSKGNKVAFHITDVENFVSDFEHGNHFSALRHGVRILNGALNGPPVGVSSSTSTEWSIGEPEKTKLGELEERLQSIIDQNEMRLGEAQAKRSKTAEGKTTETHTKDDEKHGARAQAPPGKGTEVEKAAMDKPKGVKSKAGKVDGKGGEIKDDDTEVEETDVPDDDGIVRTGEPGVGAVPWALILQIAMMIIKMISDFKQQA